MKASPPVSYLESLQRQRNATILLVIEVNTEHGSGITPVKFFEYLGAARPVLSLGARDSAVGRLVESSGTGIVAETADDVERALRNWLDEFELHRSVAYHGDPSVCRRYERQRSAQAMARILDGAIAGRLTSLEQALAPTGT